MNFANLHDYCQTIYDPPQQMGRPRLSRADMTFVAALKVGLEASGRGLRYTLVEACNKGYISKVPHYNSVFNFINSRDSIYPLLELVNDLSESDERIAPDDTQPAQTNKALLKKLFDLAFSEIESQPAEPEVTR